MRRLSSFSAPAPPKTENPFAHRGMTSMRSMALQGPKKSRFEFIPGRLKRNVAPLRGANRSVGCAAHNFYERRLSARYDLSALELRSMLQCHVGKAEDVAGLAGRGQALPIQKLPPPRPPPPPLDKGPT